MRITTPLLVGSTAGLGTLVTACQRRPAGPPPTTRIVHVVPRSGENEIWTMHGDGSGRAAVAGAAAFGLLGPKVSPDGTRILYAASKSALHPSDVYLMDHDGTNARQITDDLGYDDWPTWSPDGTMIAFVSNRHHRPTSFQQALTAADRSDVYVMKADGSDVRRLTELNAVVEHPDFAPDGQSIVFSCAPKPAQRFRPDIYAVAVDGSGTWQLTESTPDTPRGGRFPTHSPDGYTIAFAVQHDGAIHLMDYDGSNPRRLTSVGGRAAHPDFSPDGTRLVYAEVHDGGFDLCVIGLDGTGWTRLTDDRGSESDPDWSPLPGSGG